MKRLQLTRNIAAILNRVSKF